jgi:hypothetical protein
LAATVVFVGLIEYLGGPSGDDAFESLYSTWAIAHGHLSCAYFAGNTDGFPFRAPLYPLFSGAFAAIIRLGHGVPFPSQSQLGPHCSSSLAAMTQWSYQSGVGQSSVRLGVLSWFVLMAGLVALLRATGRGRCGWEPTALVFVASVPAVFMCIERYFHPEDLMAMGLALGSLACVKGGRWAWAGVLLGLAFTSQQFVLLIVAPLIVVAPRNRKIRFAGSAIGSAALVVAPLAVLTSGRVINAVLGAGSTPALGHTVLAAFHFHGMLLLTLSRIVPLIFALALAWWAARRLGTAILEPVPLISLVATALTFRLVFEINLFGYYFMAVAVSLIVLDVIRGRIGMYLVGWLALLTLAFDPVQSGNDPLSLLVPVWFWQILLVPAAVALAAGPLISAARTGHGSDPVVTLDDWMVPLPLPSPVGRS